MLRDELRYLFYAAKPNYMDCYEYVVLLAGCAMSARNVQDKGNGSH